MATITRRQAMQLAAAGTAWAAGCRRPARAAERPPHLIVVLADDLGAKELSCYGSSRHQTPCLDRLASEGTRFRTCWAMPLCTPTRMALMTGQYGFHNGYLGMANPAYIPAKTAPEAQIVNHLTFSKVLQQAGYATALAGKWQLSGKLPTLVREAGFDEYCMWAYEDNVPPGVRHPDYENATRTSRYWHPCLVQNGEYRPTQPADFGPDLLHDFVVDFLRRHREQPCCVYYTSLLTHQPRVETPDPAHPGERRPAGLKSNVEYLDHLVGRLDAALSDLGVRDNTLLVFLGDNGTGQEGKGTVTELGARVPGIIRGPGVRAGQISMAVTDVTDLYPTLLDYAGLPQPADHQLDGRSLRPVLEGRAERHRDWIYSHLDDGRLLRDERWLLQIDRTTHREHFYDSGTSRNGDGYRDVTAAADPTVLQARARFAAVLDTIPPPRPRPGTQPGRNRPADPA
ncbi:MAG: sulfatase-like hydrolase/transferase [Fimbriimonadaceae bacterium]|nr:sulfatase-like hydrolase/transferase [Fimbriimonadaceae bacterium]